MNYFEVLEISTSETNTEAIADAYNHARIKWQTVLAQGVGDQQKEARLLMNGKLEEMYLTLIDPVKRQQYARELKLSQESGVPIGDGRVKVSFSLHNGYSDHDFLVVENPVRHPLEADGLTVTSLQEFVCRALENPEWALQHVGDRVLERWMYYSANQKDIVKALSRLRCERPGCLPENILGIALDLMQTKYPVPILPRSPDDLLSRISEFDKPQCWIQPRMINLGVITKPEEAQAHIRIHWWQEPPQNLRVSSDEQSIKLDTSRLSTDFILGVSVDLHTVERGQELQAVIKLNCEPYGEIIVPLLVARAHRVLGNPDLRNRLNAKAGELALQVGDNASAAHYLRAAGLTSSAANAEIVQIQQAYYWHDWQQVVALIRRFHERYGRINGDIQCWMIEAQRFLTGTLYQLGEHRRALEYFAALAYETSQVKEQSKLAESWTTQPEAQFHFDLENPRSHWVAIAEQYGLNWTHPNGRANGSNYAGEVPLDLSARRVIWRTGNTIGVQSPLIAYEGVLMGRTLDRKNIVGLDAVSGRKLWSFSEGMDGSASAIPVAGDGTVFVADPKGGVYALDVTSGTVKWRSHLGEGRDISLAYEDGLLFAGTGRRFVLINARTGEEVASLDGMRSLWMDANPVNLLATNGCCLFQKVGGIAPSMVFVDMQSGKTLESEMPFVGHSLLGSIGRNLFGLSSSAAVTWAAWGEFIVIPLLISKEIECKHHFEDGEGHKKEEIEKRKWEELHLFVYAAHYDQQVAHTVEVVSGNAYEPNRSCNVRVTNVQAADACSIAPTQITEENGVTLFDLPDPHHQQHLLIAAGFARHVFYWTITDESVQRVGYRCVDSTVQSIAFLGLYDMVTTQNSLMTSFIGNVESGNATAFVFPENLGSIVGSPAIYGDLIFITTKAGEVVAIGR